MEKVSRSVGRCLTETKLKDFDSAITKYGEYVHISQFARQPKHVSEIAEPLTDNTKLSIGTVLYGVEQDGSLTWLGEVIDSSD